MVENYDAIADTLEKIMQIISLHTIGALVIWFIVFWVYPFLKSFDEAFGAKLCSEGHHKWEDLGKGYKHPPCAVKQCKRCGLYQFTVYSNIFPLNTERLIFPKEQDNASE